MTVQKSFFKPFFPCEMSDIQRFLYVSSNLEVFVMRDDRTCHFDCHGSQEKCRPHPPMQNRCFGFVTRMSQVAPSVHRCPLYTDSLTNQTARKPCKCSTTTQPKTQLHSHGGDYIFVNSNRGWSQFGCSSKLIKVDFV